MLVPNCNVVSCRGSNGICWMRLVLATFDSRRAGWLVQQVCRYGQNRIAYSPRKRFNDKESAARRNLHMMRQCSVVKLQVLCLRWSFTRIRSGCCAVGELLTCFEVDDCS